MREDLLLRKYQIAIARIPSTATITPTLTPALAPALRWVFVWFETEEEEVLF
jgi:hypothetical protein